jgi:hypothetical protein
MSELVFERNRRKANLCPCGKSNKDGKFAPFKGFENKGFCHSCGILFNPDNENEGLIQHFTPEAPKPISYHSPELVKESLNGSEVNNFVLFLNGLFSKVEVQKAINDYRIGTSNQWTGATIFWQIDEHQKVRHGKVILYNPETGKKLKFNSVRSILKLNDFNLKQCLFGLHLINKKNVQTIGLVESEKTAILLSIFKPQFVWLATGGLSEFKEEKLRPLKQFRIIAFPDKGKLNQWTEVSQRLEQYGYRITINDWLETTSFPEETDLADVLIKGLKSKPKKEEKPGFKTAKLQTYVSDLEKEKIISETVLKCFDYGTDNIFEVCKLKCIHQSKSKSFNHVDYNFLTDEYERIKAIQPPTDQLNAS